MRRAEKVTRRNRRKRDRGRKKTKALMVASTFATAGTTLVAMAMATPAWADYTSDGFVYHPGTALQAGANVTVTAPYPVEDLLLVDPNAPEISSGFTVLSSYRSDVATATVPLFTSTTGIVTDCGGESITGGIEQYAGCQLVSADPDTNPPQTVATVGVTIAFPNVTQSASSSSGLSNGSSVTVKSNAQGDPTYAATDSVVVEECGPMPTGFTIHNCIGLATMTGSSGNYMATVKVQDPVGSTTCAGHSGSTGQCSLWTVEVHSDSTGEYWWPLANGIPISFK
jgi:hypothetical protein